MYNEYKARGVTAIGKSNFKFRIKSESHIDCSCQLHLHCGFSYGLGLLAMMMNGSVMSVIRRRHSHWPSICAGDWTKSHRWFDTRILLPNPVHPSLFVLGQLTERATGYVQLRAKLKPHKMGMSVCMWVFASLAVGIINPLVWHHVLCAVHSWKLKKIHSTGGLTAPSWDRCQASFWGGWTGDTRIQGLAGRCDICLWPPLPRRMQHKLSKCKLQIAWPSACGTKCAHNFKFITNLRAMRYERESQSTNRKRPAPSIGGNRFVC